EGVMRQANPDDTLPAVFERDNPGWRSRILPAIEGLVYPLCWRSIDSLKPYGTFATFLEGAKRHTLALLTDPQRRNLFPDGGLKLSSTSNNSWISKIAIFQHV